MDFLHQHSGRLALIVSHQPLRARSTLIRAGTKNCPITLGQAAGRWSRYSADRYWPAALEIVLDRGQIEDWFGSQFIVWMLAIASVCLTAAVFGNSTIRTLCLRHHAAAPVGAALVNAAW